MDDPVYRRIPELMEADIGDELVALDTDRGQCFGFNSVATSVWRALAKPQRFSAIRDSLLDEYAVDSDECSGDLRELLDDMIAKGLVRVD